MRPMDLRARRAYAAAAALGLTYVVSPQLPGEAQAAGSTSPANAPSAQLSTPVLAYGKRALVSGRLTGGQPGAPVTLEYEPSGSTQWVALAHSVTRAGGAYRLSAPVPQSGALRVDPAPVAQAAVARGALTPSAGASSALPIQVRAGVSTHQRHLDVLGSGDASVTGTLAPARAGRRVALQVRGANGWNTVARASTGAAGRFRLSYTAHQTGSQPVRVRFAGDAVNAASIAFVGRLNVYRLAEASWYSGGGSLACGGSLSDGTMGVANKTLPCGTMVSLHYGGRTVRVPVIDRGPYVAGREFDLTAATKDALGFPDTGAVWTTAA